MHCVSSDLSYRYTIETRVLTADIWFSDEKQNCYTICLHVFYCSISGCESLSEWLKHFAAGSLLELEKRVRIPFYIADRCGYGCQAQKSYWKCKLKLRLEPSRFIFFFFLMKHVSIQINRVWAHYFKLFNRVQSIQDEKARLWKEMS